MKPPPPLQEASSSHRLWLFLDYDGTLAEFAPSPESAIPNPEVIGLLQALVKRHDTRISIITGRMLSQIEQMVPVPGILLAGTYGVEMLGWDGERVNRLEYEKTRPPLERIKGEWQVLLDGKKGFYLEDKGWALALHAKLAEEKLAEQVMDQAVKIGEKDWPGDSFEWILGYRFLEIGSRLIDKGQTVGFLLDEFPWPGSLPIYIGDDQRDEEAFPVVEAAGGMTITVGSPEKQTRAQYQLGSPAEVRDWLSSLLQDEKVEQSREP